MWDIKGLVITPQGRWFDQTHCMLPTPEHLQGSIYRIYYAGRNNKNQSHIACADIDLDALEVSYREKPVLTPGPLGRFDDNGVLPSCKVGSSLYYIGFKPGGTVRMQLQFGVYDQVFRSTVPTILNDIGIATAPYVCEGGFYYVDGIEWIDKDTPRYDIKRQGFGTVIPLNEGENALARPYVLSNDNGYQMWFSAKGDTYRGQYAESPDGINWERKPYDFPEEEMAYPIVLKHKGKEFMFYNKGYGENGICLAVR